jgi:hypothetical protein
VNVPACARVRSFRTPGPEQLVHCRQRCLLESRVRFFAGKFDEPLPVSNAISTDVAPIPSLATMVCSLFSTRNCCFFRLCQIRAMDLPGCMIFAGLKLGSPFLVMPADNGGSITKDGCNHLDTLALP